MSFPTDQTENNSWKKIVKQIGEFFITYTPRYRDEGTKFSTGGRLFMKINPSNSLPVYE